MAQVAAEEKAGLEVCKGPPARRHYKRLPLIRRPFLSLFFNVAPAFMLASLVF
jgi:hypothetical protein